MNDIGEVRSGERAVGVHVVVADPRDPEIGHDFLPIDGVPPPFQFTFVTKYRPVGNWTIAENSNCFNT